MDESNRMKSLPKYLFTIIDDLKRDAIARGLDIIDLGMGNPDRPTPDHVIEELCKRAKDPKNHGYSRSIDSVECELRKAIADWYKSTFNVVVDPNSEIVPLIGSKEGIAHISLALLNNEDIALVPDPSYPVHFNGVLIAGGSLHQIPMNEENDFLPDFDSIPADILLRSKIIFLSYPNNPTTAVVPEGFFEKAVSFAKKNDIVLIHDLAYSEIVFDGYRAPSILEIPGAKEVAIEFHSMSKTFNMAGWRIGFAVGNAKILGFLSKTKGYMDFGLFKPIQYAAIKALTGSQECVREQIEVYRERRDIVVDALGKVGWKIPKPKATFYLWAKIPGKYKEMTSMEFVSLLIKETGVVLSPGMGFGRGGEGFVRLALVDEKDRLKEAAVRIGKLLQK